MVEALVGRLSQIYPKSLSECLIFRNSFLMSDRVLMVEMIFGVLKRSGLNVLVKQALTI
jgi:hypothetical protein